MQQDRHLLSVRNGPNLPNEVTSLLRSLGPSPKGDLNRGCTVYWKSSVSETHFSMLQIKLLRKIILGIITFLPQVFSRTICEVRKKNFLTTYKNV
jgi:hypothetical protein